MVTVWIMEHDDPEVQYVVNELENMRENYADLVADGFFAFSFEEYLASWTRVEMPTRIFEADYPVRNAWIEERY